MKKKILKRLLTGVLTLGLVASVFTGCGKKADNKEATNSGDKVYRTLDEIKESGTIKINRSSKPC